jgi:hypothetical protein
MNGASVSSISCASDSRPPPTASIVAAARLADPRYSVSPETPLPLCG